MLTKSKKLPDLIGAGLELVFRLYGVFFLALAALFVYWSARGLLAYEAGIRAAWADPLAAAAGLGATALSFWAGIKIVRGRIPPSTIRGSGSSELDATIAEAMKLERSDPQAARQLLDGYFIREAQNTQYRREELRQRAEHDLSVAVALRKELQGELADSRALKKDMLKHVPADQRDDLLHEADETDRELSNQLAELDSLIKRHELR